MAKFAELRIRDWRQFRSVDLQFHPRLTVLTGENGAGKTTLLNILSQHFGWSWTLLIAPKIGATGGLDFTRAIPGYLPGQQQHVGDLIYDSGAMSPLTIHVSGGPTTNLGIQNMTPVSGLFVPSHRPPVVYQQVQSIPASFQPREQLFSQYMQELRYRFVGSHSGFSPTYRLKEALISLVAFGYGNPGGMEPNHESIATYEGFVEILRKVLPPRLGFRGLRVRAPEVVVATDTGDFTLDAMSGGIAAIIDLAWQLHMVSLTYGEFVAVIDEPENHLHPELQRTLFPTFMRAFPSAQFVASTHNPFIVGSTPDSAVYVLAYTDDHKVVSHKMDDLDKSGSSNALLREALGLDSTVPFWVQEQLDAIRARYTNAPLSEESLDRLRDDLSVVGMSHLFPETLNRLLEERRD